MRDKYHIKQNRKAFLYPRELKKFYSTLSHRQQPYFKIVSNTGGRINEILYLTPNDINYERHQLTFRITKVKAKKKQKRPEPRTILISSEFAAWLKRYVKSSRIKLNEPIVRIGKSAIYKIIQCRLKTIRPKDFRDFSSHNFRKTHGNWLLAVGVPGQEVALRLGHDMDTLLEHYASPTLFNVEDKINIVDELGDLYKDLRRI